MEDRVPEEAESDLTCLVDQKNGNRMIKQLLNSVIAKYRGLSVSCRSIICFSLRQIIDLLATDKSRYFTHPRSIIVNYVKSYSVLPKQGCEALMLSPQLALCLGLPTCINYS